MPFQNLVATVMLTATPAAATSPDPVFAWVDRLVSEEAVRLCMETAPSETVGPEPSVRIDRPYDIPATLAALRASEYPVRFTALELGGRTVLVPTEVRVDGVWKPYAAPLDTIIDLGPGEPAYADIVLDRWMAALSAALGQQVFFNSATPLNSYGTCSVTGRGRARDLLAAILDCRGKNDVWRMGPGNPFGSPGVGYVLSLTHYWHLDEAPTYEPGREWAEKFFSQP